jgi:signal transduction histidine kinase/CheY-like chemotaxis protein/ligand-binding sensor protein
LAEENFDSSSDSNGDSRTVAASPSKSSAFPGLNPNPVAEIAPDGRIIFVNASARRLFPDLWRLQAQHPWLQNLPPAAEAACAREVAIGERWFHQDILWADKSRTFLIYGFDITEAKRTQEALRESESRVQRKLHSITSPQGDIRNLELSDIVDVPALQNLLDHLYGMTDLPLGVIDDKGKILAGVGWQDICTRFHRVHPETCKNCIASDTQLSSGIVPGEFRLYKCKNNMWDVATPIVVEGRRVGNLFSGQFFFDDEEPERAFFEAQAQRYGFAEEEYLAALDRVPRRSRKLVETTMKFFSGMAQSLSHASWSNISLARSVTEAKLREEELLRLNRALSARNLIDQTMIRAQDELEYAHEACDIVVKNLGHAMVWIGFAEQDKKKTVRPFSSAGYEDGYLATLDLTWADTERGRGPVGTAIRTGKVSICQNVLTDRAFKPWRQQALHCGFSSAIGLPLRADGKTFGVIAIYSKEPDAFDEQEARLLSGLAGDVSYGICALRTREARKQAEAHFQEAQKMEAVGLLAGGIAHDFNNILAILHGCNHLLLEGLRPGHPMRAYSQQIQDSLEVGGTLTHQLLGISGNRGAQKRFLEPNSVILQMLKMLRRLLPDNIRLEKKLHRAVWSVKMGSGQLEQILLNLAVNARDAMPKGGRLVLTTRNLSVKSGRGRNAKWPSVPGHYVLLEVRDTGSGMSPQVKARLFEPFFTTKGPGRGTGLGLSTIRTIVDESGGHITVESKPGKGTDFRIYLPSGRGGAKGVVSQGNAKKNPSGHGDILVAEDNEALLKIIKMTLQKKGYTVFSGHTAAEILAISGDLRKPPALLLTDVVLPDLDGPELAKHVKEKWPQIRTVYMSGYPGNALGPIGGYGSCVMLEKPFSLDHLLKTLRDVLARGQDCLF